MNKKWLLIWLTAVFALFLSLAVYTFHEDKPVLLICSEIVIPVLYSVTVWVIARSLKPISSIGRSLNLLREEDFTVTMVKTGNKEVDNIIEVYNSMIKRLREERLSVREKNHFLDLLIESSPLGIIIMNLDDRVSEINKAGYGFLGLHPGNYQGKYLHDLNSNLANAIGKIKYEEKQLIVPADGQKYLCRKLYFMDHGFRHPFYIIEEFTEEIRKAGKEAYGKLIRMMAHEVNNTVGPVNSILSTIQSNSNSFAKQEQEEIIKVLGVAIQRNYQLNRFMKNFSDVVKLPPPDKETMDVNESVKIVLDSFSTILREKNIAVNARLDTRTPLISADRSQMEQVFANILKNSIEAICSKGRITVITENNPVIIRFEDNGTGLSEENFERIFTPFFTTKPGGQGIGLTLVTEILSNHGFSFNLSNKEGGGTEFIIRCSLRTGLV